MKRHAYFEMELRLQIETFYAIKKGIAHRAKVWHTFFMPSQGAPDKTYLTVRVPIVLKRRLERLAVQRGETVTDLVIGMIQKSVSNVELTADDFAQIAKEVAAAEQKFKAKSKSKQS